MCAGEFCSKNLCKTVKTTGITLMHPDVDGSLRARLRTTDHTKGLKEWWTKRVDSEGHSWEFNEGHRETGIVAVFF